MFMRFFVRFLVYEICSILYSTVAANSELETCEKKCEIFANLIQTLINEDRVSIRKHAGSKGAAPVGGKPPIKTGVLGKELT